MNYIKFYLLNVLLFFVSFSCSEDDKMEMIEQDQEENPIENLEMLSVGELDYITDLLIVDDIMEDVWRGYDYLRTHPIYIITSENEGIFINPPESELPNSRKIFNEIGGFEGLDMYRNDELLAFAKKELCLGFYCFTAEYNGFNIFLYDTTFEPTSWFYDQYKDRNGYFHVSIFYHELFHSYQFESYEQKVFPNAFIDFPIDEDTLPLLMLLFDVMIDSYEIETESERRKHLGFYTSIASALESVDTSDDKLIRNYGFAVEKGEGAARYVEVFSTLYALNNNTIEDPTHGFKEYADNEINSALNIKQVYARRIFYHTGAGALHLLKQLGDKDLENSLFFIPGNTPYDVANDFLDLNESEKESFLQEAKNLYNWEDILARANYLLDL